MEGAVDPTSRTAEEFGIRPNNRNEVLFKPAKGKIIDSLHTGVQNITIRFWPEKEGPSSSRAVSWQISVM